MRIGTTDPISLVDVENAELRPRTVEGDGQGHFGLRSNIRAGTLPAPLMIRREWTRCSA